MAALVLRIKFPPTYPLIYKTLRVDAKFTSKEAVRFIADTVNVTSLLQGSEGLYIPDEKRWLDDATPLTAYDSLQDVVRIFSGGLRSFLQAVAGLASSWAFLAPCRRILLQRFAQLYYIFSAALVLATAGGF